MKLLLSIILIYTCSFAFASESAFDELTPLSLQDEEASETYIHQGLAQKEYTELCKKNENKHKDICTEDRAAFSGGMGKTLETIVTPNNTVDVSHLTKGIYFLQIQMNNTLVSKKFIKK